jgi:MerR family transcriptional regulator, light-induced transcriptional regulator
MSTEPRYNIRAVERMTSVPAPTLRSWERRYGFPAPARTATARRLYSDEDVRAIRWVREQTERGLSVAQAIEWAQAGGHNEGLAPTGAAPAPAAEDAVPAATLVQALVDGVTHYDEAAVERAMTTAFAHYPSDYVLLDIITPALVEVGEAWARGDLPVAAEHFFSSLVRRRLMGLLAAQPAITPRASIALACLPNEQHELGLLMLALFLRWGGIVVLYLGADVPVEDLGRLAASGRVDALCLSGGREAEWDALRSLVGQVRAAGNQVPIYVGGPGLGERSLPEGVVPLGGDLRQVVRRIVDDLAA